MVILGRQEAGGMNPMITSDGYLRADARQYCRGTGSSLQTEWSPLEGTTSQESLKTTVNGVDGLEN